MKLSFSLGSMLTIDEIIECTKKLNEVSPDVIWIPETWGNEKFFYVKFSLQTNHFF